MSKKLQSHPYADRFPMMSSAEIDALAQDIAENGLRQPIILYKGCILDGRNRLRACTEAEVEPQFTTFEGTDEDALKLVISLNLQRREMTAAQRALVAVRHLPDLREQARKRQEAAGEHGKEGGRGKRKTLPQKVAEGFSGEARNHAASLCKVNHTYIYMAEDLLLEAADLAEKVDAGILALKDAHKELQDRKKRAEQDRRNAERVAEYLEAIQNGEMTLEEALQKAMEEERKKKETQEAQASSRRRWLTGLRDLLQWSEDFIATHPDDYFPWYFDPNAPGSFEHEITAARVAAAIAQLERVKTNALGGSFDNGEKVQSSSEGTRRSRP